MILPLVAAWQKRALTLAGISSRVTRAADNFSHVTHRADNDTLRQGMSCVWGCVWGGVCVCVCVRGGKCMCVREGGNEREPECVWGVCGYVPACVVCVSARARVCGGENNHCNPAILFNEEWKAGIQRCGYVPHINVRSVDILPLFR